MNSAQLIVSDCRHKQVGGRLRKLKIWGVWICWTARTARTAKTTKTAKTSLAENERQQGQGQKEGLEEGLEEDRQQGQPETDKRRKTAEGRGGDDQKISK